MPQAFNYKGLHFWSKPLSVHLKTTGQLQGKREREKEKRQWHWTGQCPATEEAFFLLRLFWCLGVTCVQFMHCFQAQLQLSYLCKKKEKNNVGERKKVLRHLSNLGDLKRHSEILDKKKLVCSLGRQAECCQNKVRPLQCNDMQCPHTVPHRWKVALLAQTHKKWGDVMSRSESGKSSGVSAPAFPQDQDQDFIERLFTCDYKHWQTNSTKVAVTTSHHLSFKPI